MKKVFTIKKTLVGAGSSSKTINLKNDTKLVWKNSFACVGLSSINTSNEHFEHNAFYDKKNDNEFKVGSKKLKNKIINNNLTKLETRKNYEYKIPKCKSFFLSFYLTISWRELTTRRVIAVYLDGVLVDQCYGNKSFERNPTYHIEEDASIGRGLTSATSFLYYNEEIKKESILRIETWDFQTAGFATTYLETTGQTQSESQYIYIIGENE